MEHPLSGIVKKQKAGIAHGICSICSANQFVVEAALEHGNRHGLVVLIEATSNQVNQYGGYTGMTPADFVRFVEAVAEKSEFPLERLILGGDHLGPNPWRSEAADKAMEKACVLVRDYARAGFTKIHLDASMHLGDDAGDRTQPLDRYIVAQRTALLCQAAEEGYRERLRDVPDALAPVYIIGTEVPVPGGVQGNDDELSVTTPEDFNETVRLTREAFNEHGLSAAWDRVVGVVVQPGVEFGNDFIHEYDREKAQALSNELKKHPNFVFEGHSTDYQRPDSLRQMVEDGLAILKVGPEATFALREALFLLEHIERELCDREGKELSNLSAVVREVMLEEPQYWESYYDGPDHDLRLSLRYSLSDRIRYYWPHGRVAESISKLISNLDSVDIPWALLSQYMPIQYRKVRAGEISNTATSLIKDHIAEVFEKYRYATQPQTVGEGGSYGHEERHDAV